MKSNLSGNPNILQTISASLWLKWSWQISIQWPPLWISIRPSHGPFPPINRVGVVSVNYKSIDKERVSVLIYYKSNSVLCILALMLNANDTIFEFSCVHGILSEVRFSDLTDRHRHFPSARTCICFTFYMQILYNKTNQTSSPFEWKTFVRN